jgi:hypothetical protein
VLRFAGVDPTDTIMELVRPALSSDSQQTKSATGATRGGGGRRRPPRLHLRPRRLRPRRRRPRRVGSRCSRRATSRPCAPSSRRRPSAAPTGSSDLLRRRRHRLRRRRHLLRRTIVLVQSRVRVVRLSAQGWVTAWRLALSGSARHGAPRIAGDRVTRGESAHQCCGATRMRDPQLWPRRVHHGELRWQQWHERLWWRTQCSPGSQHSEY